MVNGGLCSNAKEQATYANVQGSTLFGLWIICELFNIRPYILNMCKPPQNVGP